MKAASFYGTIICFCSQVKRGYYKDKLNNLPQLPTLIKPRITQLRLQTFAILQVYSFILSAFRITDSDSEKQTYF